MTVRPLQAADLADAIRLEDAAGWNQTEADWRRMIALEPELCLAVECDGHVVATATATCYGTRLAWIGMVLTQAEYRGRGFARALMGALAARLAARGVVTVKLDATAMGAPLYRKLGFVDECAIERWKREPAPCAGAACEPFRFDAALDGEAFGADRARLIEDLAGGGGEGAAVEGGFALAREGSTAAYFGPCVARSAQAGERLAHWFTGRHSEEAAYWDLLPSNRAAATIAAGLGFARVRELVRMRFGPAGPEQDGSKVFAIAGFEFG